MAFLKRPVRIGPVQPKFDRYAAPLQSNDHRVVLAALESKHSRQKYAIAESKKKKEVKELEAIQSVLKDPRCTPLLSLTIRRAKTYKLKVQLAKDTLALWELKESYPKLETFDCREDERERRNTATAAKLSSGESVWIKINHKCVKNKFFRAPIDLPVGPIRNGGASSAVSHRIEIEA